MKKRFVVLLTTALAFASIAGASPIGYTQTNLVSNGAVPANVIDPHLQNPWGISFGPNTPFWTANNGTGTSTLYEGNGAIVPLVVTVPPAPGSPGGTLGTPTGTVFNPGASGGQFMGDRFLFATEDGTISGWQGGTTALVRADNSASGAVFKGLATLNNRIYATDFAHGTVAIFDTGYNPVNIAGAFQDPTLPSGYSPFGIQQIGGSIFVTFARKEDSGNDDVAGPGFGFVDKFDENGALIQRLITGVPGDPNSPLNSPWGIALAPSGFGDLSNLLLVGNFGNGKINAFDPATGAFVSSLNDANGNPIVIDGLWGLAFGNNRPSFDPHKLYFTAGLNDEADGLFGSLQPAPEPGTWLLVGAGVLAVGARRKLHRF